MIKAINQLVVIMARGDSRRMGRPKGLCRLDQTGAPLITRVHRLYSDMGIPILLVTRSADQEAYDAIVKNDSIKILSAPGGGDTALTMKLALDWSKVHGINPDYFWAHPVDLPLVRPQTINALLAAASPEPLTAWRPVCNHIPGHPVLVPGVLLPRILEAESADAAMSQVLKEAETQGIISPLQWLEVDDTGIFTDFDSPAQLQSKQKPKASES